MISVLVPVVGGLYSRAGSGAALASIGAGVATLLFVRFVLASRYPWLDATLAGLIAAAVAFGLGSLMSRRGSATPGRAESPG